MQMRCMEHKAQFPALLRKSTQQCHRIGAAGESDGKTHAGLQQRGIESERR
jgi:hypothetical protein